MNKVYVHVLIQILQNYTHHKQLIVFVLLELLIKDKITQNVGKLVITVKYIILILKAVITIWKNSLTTKTY